MPNMALSSNKRHEYSSVSMMTANVTTCPLTRESNDELLILSVFVTIRRYIRLMES